MSYHRLLTAVALGILSGCRNQGAGESDEARGTATAGAADSPSISLDTVATGLEVPWSLAFAPDGRIFVTERVGRIRLIENGVLREEPWATLSVTSVGESGLMGIALAPDFSTSRHVYVVGTFGPRDELVNRVVRFVERDGRGVEPVVVIDGMVAAAFHAGNTIAFGPDGMLYVATGDARQPHLAQERGSLAGKILRYRSDGSVPHDNPFPGSPVYALGLRNVQGLSWYPETGDLFATEHGPSGFPNERFRRDRDELNVIRGGGNYGWPEVAGIARDRRFVDPIAEWTPAIAPSGIAVHSGETPAWQGSVFVAGLRGRQLRRVIIGRTGDDVTPWRLAGEEVLFQGELGRIRAVAMGLDGHLYFTTSNRDGRGTAGTNDDRILRLMARDR